MAIVLLRVSVAYPSECLEAIKNDEPTLKAAGMLAGSTAMSAESHNVVYFMLTWKSVDSARRFWGSLEGKKVVARLQSVESPEVLVLEDAREL
jgi:hypothetical protein